MRRGDCAWTAESFHADYVVRLVLGRYRTADNSLPTKHVVAAGLFARDAGSTPAASTTFKGVFVNFRTVPYNLDMSSKRGPLLA